MQEIKISYKGKTYILNNNNGKYDRVFDPKFNPEFKSGKKLTNEQIISRYDSFAGLILDENRNKVPMFQFWNEYKEKIERKNKRLEIWNKIKNFFKSLSEFVQGFWMILAFVVLIIGLLSILFGFGKIMPFIKTIKGLM